MLQVTTCVGVYLLIDLVAQVLRSPLIHAEPGGYEVVDLHSSDFVVSDRLFIGPYHKIKCVAVDLL